MTKQVRDWQFDTKLCSKVKEIGHTDVSADIVTDIAIYWLQQYKELEWNNENLLSRVHEAESTAAAEKERADQEKRNHKTVRSMLNNEQVAHSITKDREKKLREAIEAAINEKSQWGDAGNALDVITRYLSDTLASLYPKEEEVNE